MGKRSFDELSVVATGVQDFEGRFGKRRRADIGDDIPPISSWRCNLVCTTPEHVRRQAVQCRKLIARLADSAITGTQPLPRRVWEGNLRLCATISHAGHLSGTSPDRAVPAD